MLSPLAMLTPKLQFPWAEGVTVNVKVPVELAAMEGGGDVLMVAEQPLVVVMFGELTLSARLPVLAMVKGLVRK